MRLKASELSFKQDKCFFNGRLFTGVGFYMEKGRVTSIIEYLNGRSIGEYESPWICIKESKLAIDKDALESNDGFEPFIWEGKRFTGVAYDFDEERCVGELLIENGLIKEEISFFDGNSPAFYESSNQGLEQDIS